jgi:hypothetical protein
MEKEKLICPQCGQVIAEYDPQYKIECPYGWEVWEEERSIRHRDRCPNQDSFIDYRCEHCGDIYASVSYSYRYEWPESSSIYIDQEYERHLKRCPKKE